MVLVSNPSAHSNRLTLNSGAVNVQAGTFRERGHYRGASVGLSPQVDRCGRNLGIIIKIIGAAPSIGHQPAAHLLSGDKVCAHHGAVHWCPLPVRELCKAIRADSIPINGGVHVVLIVGIVNHAPVKLIPALPGITDAVVKQMPGGPAPAVDGGPHHVGAIVRVLAGLLAAYVDANMAVIIGSARLQNGQSQSMDTGQALFKQAGENAVLGGLGSSAAHAAANAQIGEVGVNQARAVRDPHAAHSFALAPIGVLPAFVIGHNTVLCQSQVGGGTCRFSAQSPCGQAGAQSQRRQQETQRPFGRAGGFSHVLAVDCINCHKSYLSASLLCFAGGMVGIETE